MGQFAGGGDEWLNGLLIFRLTLISSGAIKEGKDISHALSLPQPPAMLCICCQNS